MSNKIHPSNHINQISRVGYRAGAFEGTDQNMSVLLLISTKFLYQKKKSGLVKERKQDVNNATY